MLETFSTSQNKMAHILTLAMEHMEGLKPSSSFLSGTYDSENENMAFFSEKILPYLDNLILFRAPFLSSLEALEKKLDTHEKQMHFWGGVVVRNFHHADILLPKDEQAQTSLRTFAEKLSQASKEENLLKMKAIFEGFMGELIKSKNGLSVMIIHNFLYLTKKMGALGENNTNDIGLTFVSDCLLKGLKLQGKITFSKELQFEEKMMQDLITTLMTFPLFDIPYKRETYEGKTYPVPEKQTLLAKFKQLRLSGKKDLDTKKYATTESPIDSSRQRSNTASKYDEPFLSPLLARERSASKVELKSATLKAKFDPNQFGGFAYVLPLPGFELNKTKAKEDDNLNPLDLKTACVTSQQKSKTKL